MAVLATGKSDDNWPSQLQKLITSLEILCITSVDIILSRE